MPYFPNRPTVPIGWNKQRNSNDLGPALGGPNLIGNATAAAAVSNVLPCNNTNAAMSRGIGGAVGISMGVGMGMSMGRGMPAMSATSPQLDMQYAVAEMFQRMQQPSIVQPNNNNNITNNCNNNNGSNGNLQTPYHQNAALFNLLANSTALQVEQQEQQQQQQQQSSHFSLPHVNVNSPGTNYNCLGTGPGPNIGLGPLPTLPHPEQMAFQSAQLSAADLALAEEIRRQQLNYTNSVLSAGNSMDMSPSLGGGSMNTMNANINGNIGSISRHPCDLCALAHQEAENASIANWALQRQKHMQQKQRQHLQRQQQQQQQQHLQQRIQQIQQEMQQQQHKYQQQLYFSDQQYQHHHRDPDSQPPSQPQPQTQPPPPPPLPQLQPHHQQQQQQHQQQSQTSQILQFHDQSSTERCTNTVVKCQNLSDIPQMASGDSEMKFPIEYNGTVYYSLNPQSFVARLLKTSSANNSNVLPESPTVLQRTAVKGYNRRVYFDGKDYVFDNDEEAPVGEKRVYMLLADNAQNAEQHIKPALPRSNPPRSGSLSGSPMADGDSNVYEGQVGMERVLPSSFDRQQFPLASEPDPKPEPEPELYCDNGGAGDSEQVSKSMKYSKGYTGTIAVEEMEKLNRAMERGRKAWMRYDSSEEWPPLPTPIPKVSKNGQSGSLVNKKPENSSSKPVKKDQVTTIRPNKASKKKLNSTTLRSKQ